MVHRAARSSYTRYATALVVALIAVWAATAPGAPPRRRLASAHRVHPAPRPHYDPARYSTRIDNPWFPLKPGIVYVYRGTEEGERSRDVVHVTKKSIDIAGVSCRIVKDDLFLGGRLAEKTNDYYAQDDDGNVWYFGEDTAELGRNGNVKSREGTWRTGRKGAVAGVIMQANPQVGDQFQQELYRHHAEDHYVVVSLSAHVHVPYGTFGRNPLRRNVELTKEWSPLEPHVRDHKYYARGIGEVMETTVRGPKEVGKLVAIRKR